MSESKVLAGKKAEAAMAEVGIEEGGVPEVPKTPPLEVVKEIVEEVLEGWRSTLGIQCS